MNQEDRAEIRQMLTDILGGYTEEMKGRYNVIQATLVQIKEQTTKTNGRVTVVEDKIEVLEKSDISKRAIFKFVGALWVAAMSLIGSVIGILQLTK